jgi:hypothetical protein
MKLACLLLTLILVTILSGSGSATVNILVSTYDGLVIAADSRVTLTDSGLVRIASDTYQKVFQVGTYTGVSSSGAAFLINPSGQLRSIGSILNEFAAAKGISDTSRVYPQVFAEDLRGHLLTLFRTEQANLLQGEVDLLVFGYDQDSRRRIFDIVVPILKRTSDGQPVIEAEMTESFASGVPGSIIRGQQDVYFRLIKGYDPSLMQVAYFDSIKRAT